MPEQAVLLAEVHRTLFCCSQTFGVVAPFLLVQASVPLSLVYDLLGPNFQLPLLLLIGLFVLSLP